MTSALPTFPWLTTLICLPLIGAFLCLLHRKRPVECRWLSLVTTLVEFAIVIWLYVTYGDQTGWMLYEDAAWIDRLGIRFTLGMDGLSLLMLLLTSFLQVIAVLISWREERHAPLFYSLLLFLETGILGVFLAQDLVLFYIFWEVMLIPMFFLIGVWGHDRRIYAALKFFLFTLAGSLLMLVAVIVLYLQHGQQTGDYTFALSALVNTDLPLSLEYLLYAGFLAAFLVKVPLFPFHSWLPDAHTEAPPAGSVDLAGLLLKTGVYGMVRFAFPLFPAAARASLPILAILGLIGIFYTAWIAYAQTDIKRLIAYSSISHMGLVIIGFAAWNLTAIEGSILLMYGHGITTGAMFVMVAMVKERTGTRQIENLGGLWKQAPALSAFFLLFSMASLGMPGLSNFAGEIMVLLGTFKTHPVWGTLGICGLVLAAAYMLRMVQGVLWGPAQNRRPFGDITGLDALMLVSLAIMVLWVGLYPATFLEPLHGPVHQMIATLSQTTGGAP